MSRSQVTQSENSLRGVAIFAALSSDAVERIQRRCAWRRYAPGEPIVDYLDASDDVFFIALGEVRVTIYSTVGKAVSFREVTAGEIFGEFPAIDGGARSASVEARTSCLIASMPGTSFRELLQSEPGLAQALLPRSGSRTRSKSLTGWRAIRRSSSPPGRISPKPNRSRPS
jgi:CRP/FNR family transcriptional regulator, cyclic AMP receptor protein